MQLKKRENLGGDFAKKGVDINNGDIVTILDSGKMIEGQFGEQAVFSIKTKNGDKIASFNQTSINALVDEFGEETENWVGEKISVIIIKQNVAGKFIDVVYFAPKGYSMGENGLVKAATPNDEVPIDDIPVIK